MKTIIYNCDFCGRELDIFTTDICTVIGGKNRKHATHQFKLHLCKWCYEKLWEEIYKKLIGDKKKNVRRRI